MQKGDKSSGRAHGYHEMQCEHRKRARSATALRICHLLQVPHVSGRLDTCKPCRLTRDGRAARSLRPPRGVVPAPDADLPGRGQRGDGGGCCRCWPLPAAPSEARPGMPSRRTVAKAGRPSQTLRSAGRDSRSLAAGDVHPQPPVVKRSASSCSRRTRVRTARAWRCRWAQRESRCPDPR